MADQDLVSQWHNCPSRLDAHRAGDPQLDRGRTPIASGSGMAMVNGRQGASRQKPAK